ncbi:unnamed protein product, partial [marine sediment metagenome]
MSNSLGKIFTVTNFGESHGQCIGIIVDGCPAGLTITEKDFQREVDKRKSVTGAMSTPRTEADKVEVLSGVFNDATT